MIFEAFFQGAVIRTTAPYRTDKGKISISDPISDNTSLLSGLLLVSKQVRREALPYLYRHLVVSMDAILVNINSYTPWVPIKPRMAASDLQHFRNVVRKVDLGAITYRHPTYTWTDVVDLDLSALKELKRIEFRLILSDLARADFLDGVERVNDAESRSCENVVWANVLRDRWTVDVKRCFGLTGMTLSLNVRPFVCSAGRSYENRFVSSFRQVDSGADCFVGLHDSCW